MYQPSPPMQGYQQPYANPAPAYGQPQPQYQQPLQPARNYVQSDRLPPMPGMLQRPAPQQPAATVAPTIRGGAPEVATRDPRPVPPTSQMWRPIQIPSPAELGIATASTRPVQPTTSVALELPRQYDLTTVSEWLDGAGVRSCQREKLAEGIQFVCSLGANQPPITVRANTEREALQKLVQEVARQKQALTLNPR